MSINHLKLKKYSRVAWQKIKHSTRCSIFLNTGFWIPVPLKIYYTVADKCNFRCLMCPHWSRGLTEKESSHLSLQRMQSIIDEMAILGIIELGISGGEPLLQKETVLSLLKYANQKGLYTHFVTNGSLLTKEFAKEYNDAGGGHISLSLDGIGTMHDNLRGYQGAFLCVEKVLNIFRDNRFANINLKINFTLNNKNLNHAVPVIHRALHYNAMIYIHPYDLYDFKQQFTIQQREEKYPLWVKKENYARLKTVIEEILELKKKYPAHILNDPKHLSGIPGYFMGQSKINCYAGLDSLAINPQGQVIFCKYGIIGDLSKQDLIEFLGSAKRKTVLKKSFSCSLGCMLGCQFRPSMVESVKNGPKQFLKLIQQ
jgi:MoaA/NifB/PqqE/SkfB family radical SAM enzyme